MAFEEAVSEELKENHKKSYWTLLETGSFLCWQKFSNTIPCTKVKSVKCTYWMEWPS